MKRTKQWNWLWFGLLVTMILTLTACGGGGGGGTPAAPVPAAALTVDQTARIFTATVEGGTNPADQTFTIGNGGSVGTTLNWTATSDKTWLTLTPASGAIVQGATATTVTASVNIAGLTAGTQTAMITVAATGLPSKTISVTLTIGAALTSTAAANPPVVSGNTGTNPPAQIVQLANAGTATLNWTAASDVNWLTVAPNSGALASGTSVNISVNMNSLTLVAGTHTGKVTISAPGVADLVIPVTLTLTAPTVSSAKSGTLFVGGTAGVTQLSSLLASRALHKSAVASSEVLADAKVTATLIKPDGSKAISNTLTDSRGAYSLQMNAVSGDTLTVVIEKEGYTSINKTVTLTDADFAVADATRQVTVSGQASQAFTAVVKVDENGAFKASGERTPGFTFGLMRLPNGTQKAFASRSALRKAADSADGIPELEISIPQTWAPGATALTTRLAAFNPAEANERAMFPGEFKGVGGAIPGLAAKAATDQPEFQLESVSFFQADVTPNDGKPLTATRATGANKAAAEPTVIIKYIPQEGCGAMQKYEDRDGNFANGIQVPLYTYNPNTGKWGYLGEGTLKKWNANTSTYDQPLGEVIGTDGKLSNLACGQENYYFEIIASDWYTWWNLDYPLVFDVPEIVTVKGKVVDQAGTGIPGAFVSADGYALKDDGTPYGANSYHYAYAQNDGSFSFDILTDSPNGKTLANFKFTATNYSDWSTQPVTFVPVPPVGNISNPNNITITDRLTCTVSGKMTQKTGATESPFANVWVWAQNNDYSFYNWAETDSTGSFSMKTVCNETINLWAWGKSYTVNVNNTPVGVEKSDNGVAVVLNDIVQVNQPPEVWTWVYPYDAKVGKIVELNSSAWDLEGDYPLTYLWTIKNSVGTVAPNSGSDYYTYQWTPTAAGTYTASATVTDSQGNAKTVDQTIVVSEFANSPPVVSAWSEAPTSCDAAPNLYGNAYDPDGDTLTYSWQLNDGSGNWTDLSGEWAPYGYDPVNFTWGYIVALNGTVSYSGNTNGYSDDFRFFASTNPIGEVRLAANDGQATTYQYLTLSAAGGIQISYAEAWPTMPTKGQNVDLYAYAYDVSGSTSPIYSWVVTAPDNSSVTPIPYWTGDNSYVYFTANQVGTYNITMTATGLCSGGESRSFQINVPAPASIDVTVQ